MALSTQDVILEAVPELTPSTSINILWILLIASIGSSPCITIFLRNVHNSSIVVILVPKTILERCWTIPSNSDFWAAVRGSKHAVQFPLVVVNGGCVVDCRCTSIVGLAFCTVVGVDACPDLPCCEIVPPQLPLLIYTIIVSISLEISLCIFLLDILRLTYLMEYSPI